MTEIYNTVSNSSCHFPSSSGFTFNAQIHVMISLTHWQGFHSLQYISRKRDYAPDCIYDLDFFNKCCLQTALISLVIHTNNKHKTGYSVPAVTSRTKHPVRPLLLKLKHIPLAMSMALTLFEGVTSKTEWEDSTHSSQQQCFFFFWFVFLNVFVVPAFCTLVSHSRDSQQTWHVEHFPLGGKNTPF